MQSHPALLHDHPKSMDKHRISKINPATDSPSKTHRYRRAIQSWLDLRLLSMVRHLLLSAARNPLLQTAATRHSRIPPACTRQISPPHPLGSNRGGLHHRNIIQLDDQPIKSRLQPGLDLRTRLQPYTSDNNRLRNIRIH